MAVPEYSGSSTRTPGLTGGKPGLPAPSVDDDASGMSGADPAGADSRGAGSEGGASEGSELPLTPQSDPDPGEAPSEEPEETPAEDAPTPPVTEPPPARLENVLVFTRVTGFRHDSIEVGVEAVRRLGQDNGFAVQHTEDPAAFTDDNLSTYEVVVWMNTDSEVLGEPEQRAFERYIRAGGGWVGVHAASATEYNWAWYGQLLGGGAFFLGHPSIQPARVVIEQADHPSTQHLPQSFSVTDEWYSFRTNPRASVQVLMTLDESSYGVGDLAMRDHPIAWYHEFDGGRAWYTALGHPIASYSDSMFTRHLLGGIRWAAGAP